MKRKPNEHFQRRHSERQDKNKTHKCQSKAHRGNHNPKISCNLKAIIKEQTYWEQTKPFHDGTWNGKPQQMPLNQCNNTVNIGGIFDLRMFIGGPRSCRRRKSLTTAEVISSNHCVMLWAQVVAVQGCLQNIRQLIRHLRNMAVLCYCMYFP